MSPFFTLEGAVGSEERRRGSWECVGRFEGVVRGRIRVEREASRAER